MMQVIQIHNNQHFEEELVLGPQCLELTMIKLECRCRQLATQPSLDRIVGIDCIVGIGRIDRYYVQ